jgi:hypothetical protein
VLGRILGDHGTCQAQAGGARQLLDPVSDVVQVDHRDALESGGIRAAEVGEPVVVRAKDGGHQQRVRHLEVKEPLRGIEDFTGHPIKLHVLEVLLGVVPAAVHVFEAPLGGDGLGASNRAPAFEIRPSRRGSDPPREDQDLPCHGARGKQPFDPPLLNDNSRLTGHRPNSLSDDPDLLDLYGSPPQ